MPQQKIYLDESGNPLKASGKYLDENGNEISNEINYPAIDLAQASEPTLAQKAGQFGLNALPGLGAAIGGAAGMGLGSIPLAGLLGGLGEGTKQAIQERYPEFYGKPPEGVGPTLTEMGKQGLYGAGQELGAKALGALGRTIMGIRNYPAEVAAKQSGIPLTVGQTQSGLAGGLQSIANAREAGQDLLAEQSDRILTRAKTIASGLGPTKEEADKIVSPLYKELDDLTKPREFNPFNPEHATGYRIQGLQGEAVTKLQNDAPVNITPVKNSVLQRFENLVSVAIEKGLIPATEESKAVQTLNKLRGASGNISFMEAHEMKSLAGDILRSEDEVFKSKAAPITSELISGLDKQMQRAAINYEKLHPGSGIWKTYQEAQSTWAQAHARQNFSDFVTKFTKIASAEGSPVDYLDARAALSSMEKMTPAELAQTVPAQAAGKFRNLLRVGVAVGKPGNATSNWLTSELGSVALNSLQSPIVAGILKAGWKVPANSPQAIALGIRLLMATETGSQAGQTAKEIPSDVMQRIREGLK